MNSVASKTGLFNLCTQKKLAIPTIITEQDSNTRLWSSKATLNGKEYTSKEKHIKKGPVEADICQQMLNDLQKSKNGESVALNTTLKTTLKTINILKGEHHIYTDLPENEYEIILNKAQSYTCESNKANLIWYLSKDACGMDWRVLNSERLLFDPINTDDVCFWLITNDKELGSSIFDLFTESYSMKFYWEKTMDDFIEIGIKRGYFKDISKE